MEEIIARKFQMLRHEWNERQKRLWAAGEAICLGHGGVSMVARATGLSRPTIHLGIRELNNNERLPENRVRREGGGRQKVTEKQPKLLASLDALVEPTAKTNDRKYNKFSKVGQEEILNRLQYTLFPPRFPDPFRRENTA